jgi:hypothetical protein
MANVDTVGAGNSGVGEGLGSTSGEGEGDGEPSGAEDGDGEGFTVSVWLGAGVCTCASSFFSTPQAVQTTNSASNMHSSVILFIFLPKNFMVISPSLSGPYKSLDPQLFD